ncbi:MAG: transglycosylase SLT domain-containing protein [Myxococcales bacterium]|nr:transglycosylase SLT domain-containing protein [Myxococcales bacterium]
MLLLLAARVWAGTLSDAVASGDCRTLVERTDPFEAAVETWRVPRAWCLLQLGDPRAADRMLEEGEPGVLQEYGRLVRARARVSLGDLDGALVALDGLELPGAAGREIKATRAEVLAQKGDVEGTKKAAAAVGGGRAGVLVGQALATAGRGEEAQTAWRAVWVAAEVGGADEEARKLLEAAGAPGFTDAERASRLAGLKKHGRIDEAAELAETLAGAGTPATPVQLAKVNLAARRYDAALEQWRLALGAPEAAKGAAPLLFDYALTFARTGDYTTAAVVYRRLIAQHPTHEKAVFASFKLGYMAYDANDCAAAGPLFAEHERAYPSSKHLDEALWFAARCHWREGRVDDATAAWSRLVKSRSSSSLVPGAVYWQARAKGRAGDAAGERAVLESVLSRFPVSGYAWYAALRLGRTFEAQPAVERPAWPESLASRDDVRRAEALLDVGFRDWARDELASVEPHLKGRESILAGAWAFIAAGDYRKGKALAAPFCVSPWKGGDPVAQQACTPRPEHGIVARVAARFDLDPLVPYGIMTAESALDPRVTSLAGARGLMQIMPAEGPRIHEELYPGRPYDADDLYSAPYNASMGTAELGLKRQSLAGVLEGTDHPAFIASYNGGEAAVRRWLAAAPEGGKLEFDEFAEDIGYTETRKYVKRVLGFVMAYRWVYGDG